MHTTLSAYKPKMALNSLFLIYRCLTENQRGEPAMEGQLQGLSASNQNLSTRVASRVCTSLFIETRRPGYPAPFTRW